MIENALNDYYKLKSSYENEVNKIKKGIINNSSLSRKEKRSEFQKLKPKCINCKRPGGTVFSAKYDQQNKSRQLRCYCGVLSNPCNLDIVIYLGEYYSLINIIEDTEKEIQEIKNTIINNKNKLLFGYITSEQAIDTFDEIKQQLKDLTDILESYLIEYNDIVDNKERNDKLTQDSEISEMLIVDIKRAVQEFINSNDTQYINDVVEIYDTKLKPTLNELINLKYKENMVWFNEDNNTYNLIQNKNTIAELEINLGKDIVKKYDVGFKQNKKDETNKRIAKSKDDIDFESELYNELDVNVEDGNNIKDNIVEEASALENDEYKQIWDKLSVKLKDALSKDNEWKTEFINSCILSKQNRKLCKFISPNNLIIPPQLLDDGTYDFGNETYNDIFNKLDKSYQNTLLTLYSIQNGKKNYRMLSDTLDNIVSKELNFLPTQI
jgi:hypothetical protein